MVYERSLRVQTHQQRGNLKVSLIDELTGVGTSSIVLRMLPHKKRKRNGEYSLICIMWPWMFTQENDSLNHFIQLPFSQIYLLLLLQSLQCFQWPLLQSTLRYLQTQLEYQSHVLQKYSEREVFSVEVVLFSIVLYQLGRWSPTRIIQGAPGSEACQWDPEISRSDGNKWQRA